VVVLEGVGVGFTGSFTSLIGFFTSAFFITGASVLSCVAMSSSTAFCGCATSGFGADWTGFSGCTSP